MLWLLESVQQRLNGQRGNGILPLGGRLWMGPISGFSGQKP